MRVGIRTIITTTAGAALLGLVPAGHAAAALNGWSTSGPGAGSVFALSVSPSDPRTIYAGAVAYPFGFGSGMYKSTDGGQRWDPIPTGLGDRDVTKVEVAPSSSNIAYVGTSDRAVYKTVDGGAHWIHTNWPNVYITSVDSLAIDPSDPQTVYASAEYIDEPYGSSIAKTTDGGRSWFQVSYSAAYALAIDPVTPDTVYAGTYDGVMKSTNGGAHWHLANNGLGSALFVNALAIDPQDPSTLYASAQDYESPDSTGIYKSTDAGQSWNLLDMTKFGDFRYGLDIAIDPLSPSTVYASAEENSYPIRGGGVFKSTDGGQTWAAAHTGLFDMLVRRLAIDPTNPSTLYAGTSSGVFTTTDGAQSWSSASVGLLASTAEAVAISPSAVYAGTAYGGVFRSTDSGVRWSPARNGMSGIDAVHSVAVDPLAPDTLYAGTSDRGMYKTMDAGASWVAVDTGLTEGYVLSVAVDTSGRVYAGTEDGVFESEDGGGHWTLVLHPFAYFFVYSVLADPQLADVAYAGAATHGVYKSTDGGSSWVPIDNGIEGADVLALAVDPTDSQVLYAGAGCYSQGEACVFKSSDGGASWQPMSAGIRGTVVNSLAVDPTIPSTVYAGTVDLGVYRSTDGGVSWAQFEDGLRNNDVSSIAVDANGTVYAATPGSGVFVYDSG